MLNGSSQKWIKPKEEVKWKKNSLKNLDKFNSRNWWLCKIPFLFWKRIGSFWQFVDFEKAVDTVVLIVKYPNKKKEVRQSESRWKGILNKINMKRNEIQMWKKVNHNHIS